MVNARHIVNRYGYALIVGHGMAFVKPVSVGGGAGKVGIFVGKQRDVLVVRHSVERSLGG